MSLCFNCTPSIEVPSLPACVALLSLPIGPRRQPQNNSAALQPHHSAPVKARSGPVLHTQCRLMRQRVVCVAVTSRLLQRAYKTGMRFTGRTPHPSRTDQGWNRKPRNNNPVLVTGTVYSAHKLKGGKGGGRESF